MSMGFDRTRDDVGNVLALEHVNLRVPDQARAALFYVTALGGTRDPHMDFGLANLWVNFGQQQFHLPTGAAQRLCGEINLVVPDLGELEQRLQRTAGDFADTALNWERSDDRLRVTCPWGNRLICAGAATAAAGMRIGITAVELLVRTGAAAGIGRFYERVLCAPVSTAGGVTRIAIGRNQQLRFRETPAALPDYDGHHIAIYLAGFSGPHRWLHERGLITEESGPHQYRFQALVDPDSGDLLAELEHEVRSLHHPMYGRTLVNRNPAQRIREYRRGRDALDPI
jgi:catechol 2,3-dioxygenase-like lactoylglutathione lyase family enzyme